MSRRLLVAVALVIASSTVSACAESVTAPRQPTLAPSTPRYEAFDPGTCRGGWNGSTGRCE